MYFDKQDKYEMRYRALLEAIRFCGGVAAYSNRIKVSRTRASNWRNKPEIAIPYEYVVLTEDVTRVSIERLSPFTIAANKVIRRLRAEDKLPPIDMALNKIIIDDCLPYKCHNLERPIIVGTDQVLISGLEQIKHQKSIKMKRSIVTVLDLESLLLGMWSLKDMKFNFLISERVAIALRLEQLINKKQNKHNSLFGCCCQEINNISELCCICDEVKENYGQQIAKIMGFANKDQFCLLRQIYLLGSSELINLLDKNQISIAMAVKHARKLKIVKECAFKTKGIDMIL